jgi:hypothetical protein
VAPAALQPLCPPWARLFVVAWALLLLFGFILADRKQTPIYESYSGDLHINWWYFVLPPAVALAVRLVASGFSSRSRRPYDRGWTGETSESACGRQCRRSSLPPSNEQHDSVNALNPGCVPPQPPKWRAARGDPMPSKPEGSSKTASTCSSGTRAAPRHRRLGALTRRSTVSSHDHVKQKN